MHIACESTEGLELLDKVLEIQLTVFPDCFIRFWLEQQHAGLLTPLPIYRSLNISTQDMDWDDDSDTSAAAIFVESPFQGESFQSQYRIVRKVWHGQNQNKQGLRSGIVATKFWCTPIALSSTAESQLLVRENPATPGGQIQSIQRGVSKSTMR